VLQQPQYVHEVVSRLRRFTSEQFYYDGAWKEGAPSYHRQVIGGLDRVFDVTEGYSDPEGYTHPDTGEHFENLNLRADIPVVSRVIAALKEMRLPNGRLVPVHDTWATSTYGSVDASRPTLLPALGHAILGRGEGDRQMQVNMTWSGGYGHIHYDGLSMLTFANGKEMLSDIGYTHTKFRPWTLATASHNTVVVDYENQYAGSNPQSDGALVFFDARDPHNQVLKVRNPQVYPELVERYERMIAVVALDDTSAYIVDDFIVSGGSQHDYFLHGSADDPQAIMFDEGALTTTPVESMLPEGMEWTPPEGEHHSSWARKRAYGYGFLRDTVMAQPQAGVHAATFDFEESDLSTTIFTVIRAGDELYAGRNPQIRHAQNDDRAVVSFERPYVMLRRTPDDAASEFVSIIEPVQGTPAISSVTLADTDGAGTALVVQTDAFTDLIGLNAVDLSGEFEGQSFSMNGPFCRIRIDSTGEPAEAYALGWVGYGDFFVDAGEPRTASLTGVERGDSGGALVVDADWSDPGPAPGTVIVLDHGDGYSHGYHVKSVQKVETGTRIETVEDPGFEFDAETGTVSYQYHPHSEHKGENIVRWTGAVSVEQTD
ncbi:MAG: heparinase II/III family protein, partial [Armatimonadota bacterium]